MPERLAWAGFACDLPAGWEVTAHRLGHAEHGEVRLHHRLDEAALLTWVALRDNPDLGRVLGEVRARLTGGEPSPPAHVVTVGRFRVGYDRPGAPCQAVGWMPYAQRMLHFAFPAFSSELLERTWTPFLEGFSERSDGTREWAIHGTGLVLPRTFSVRLSQAVAGSVVLEGQGKDGLCVTARRIGLARWLLAEHELRGVYRNVLQRSTRAKPAAVQDAVWNGLPAARTELTMPSPTVWGRILGRRWRGSGLAWHEPELNRIHTFEQWGPAKVQRLEERDVLA